MRVTAAVIVWTLFLILEGVYIEAHGGSLDDDVQQQLRQQQRGRRPKKPKVKAGDESGYVTDEEFANTVNVIQAELNSVTVKLGELEDNFEATVNADHCEDSPCVNKGACHNKLNGYYCICKPGFGGKNCEHANGHVISATLQVDNGNTEGTWNPWAMCPTGSFAAKFEVKLEAQGEGDNSAMNNVELTCKSAVTGEVVGVIKSGHGPFGTWMGIQGFPDFLVAYRLRVEPDQGGDEDDSAVNAITMTSEGGTQMTGSSNFEGDYGSTVRCPDNHYICGIATRIEQNQGYDYDDSALNDVMMRCCAWY